MTTLSENDMSEYKMEQLIKISVHNSLSFAGLIYDRKMYNVETGNDIEMIIVSKIVAVGSHGRTIKQFVKIL